MAESADLVPASGVVDPAGRPYADAGHASRYADITVELGYCSRDRADAALRSFSETDADPAAFGNYVIEEGIITREQARACERAVRGRSSIGGFAILEKVGQGGMGTVFRARQISMDRIVAVKILAPKFAQDPSFKQRFLNEARTCAKLSHLNIINGIDCGEDSGYTYFAMEFVEGCTVKQILKDKGRLEPDEAFGIVRQMAVALSYAKKFGMVHRDIKPDNIMITPAGVAKLCDLGLAMEAEQNASNEAVSATPDKAAKKDSKSDGPKEKGLALGTPHYMSPEQARGERNIDARSDIYSLGATFYHLIVGETLFTGKTSSEVMMHHVMDDVENPCTLDPEIPPGLGMIISKMMAKEATHRYADADALLADLDAVKNGTLPEAAGFNAKSSCAILPEEALRRLRAGGTPTWKRLLPHAAAALVLGGLAYFAAITFGSKPEHLAQVIHTNTVGSTSAGNLTVPKPTPSTSVSTTAQKPDEIKHPATLPVVTEKVVEVKKPPVKDPVVKPDVPDKTTETAVTIPTVPPVPPPVPKPELPRPELKLTTDILYARFLHEYEMRAGKMETQRLYTEMSDLALAASYSPARDDIKAELADLKSGWEFEIKVLKKIVEQKGEIDFNPDMARKWEVPKGRAIGYVETRGLQVEIKNGFAFYIAPSSLPAETFFAKAPDVTPLQKAQFNYARGNRPTVFALLPLLSPSEMTRWERKFGLMTAKETELKAREEFKNMAMIADAKSWKTFSEMVVDFLKDYGSTPTAKVNAVQIRQWQDAALRALEPPSKWRIYFHAAIVQDILNSKGEALVELIYDFKTPEQADDFSCMHGKLKCENGSLIVPPGGGDYAHVRFIAPFATIQTFKAIGKTLQKELNPFGVSILEAAQAVAGPSAASPMLRLDPATKTAIVSNMSDGQSAGSAAAQQFDWRKDVAIGFRSIKGDKHWTIDEKPIADAKLPKQFIGGWIVLFGAKGDQSWTTVHIIFKPDEDWQKMKHKDN